MARIKFYWLVLGTALAAAAVSAGAAESAGDVGVPKPEAAAATAAGSGSQVTGKGAGMGKIYQQNLPGPGHGAPESQGSAAGSGAQLENSAGETLQPGDDAEAAGADAPACLRQARPSSLHRRSSA